VNLLIIPHVEDFENVMIQFVIGGSTEQVQSTNEVFEFNVLFPILSLIYIQNKLKYSLSPNSLQGAKFQKNPKIDATTFLIEKISL